MQYAKSSYNKNNEKRENELVLKAKHETVLGNGTLHSKALIFGTQPHKRADC